MATYDSEEARFVDRVRAITFREARDAGATFITRAWVALKINRSESFVAKNWFKNAYEARMNVAPIGLGGRTISDPSKQIIEDNLGKRKRSVRNIAHLLEERRGKKRSHQTVFRELKRMEMKPFKRQAKPMKSDLNRENRLFFCDFLREWDEDDFLHLAPCDEFFIYSVRKPNSQNDRLWARSLDDLDESERFAMVPQKPDCIGIFILFTACSMMWVVKEDGQSWTGEYFRNEILSNHVIPFLKNPENVISSKDVCLLHDKAPCFKALATQDLLRRSGIDFFGNDEWPGNSPDLNAAEHLGAILKERVETKLIDHPATNRDDLKTAITCTLREMKNDVSLFEGLLRSYPRRLAAVREAEGGHTEF